MPFPTMTREKFSRKQTLDLQTAMATAIAGVLRPAEFPGPVGKGKIKFRKVFAEWPTSVDGNVTLAACVLSNDTIKYAPALLTPKLLEDTWEPKGGLGLGLYKVSEGECDFHVELRAPSKPERSALVAGVEQLFFAAGVLNTNPQGARYGVMVPMPEYWGLNVRLSVQDKAMGDDAESAKTNRWEAVFLIRAQANHVRLDTVAPFKVRIIELVDGESG